MRNSFLLLFVCLFVNLSYSQKYSFVTYSTEEGLPQSQVTAINQDEKGYLWVGTLGGLAKFNGNSFSTFSSSEGLLNNRIKSLSRINNTMWIGHDGGISYVKDNIIKSIEFSGDGNDRSREVSEIVEFKNKIFVSSNGGGLFVKKNNALKKIKLDSVGHERVRAMVVYDDKLYLATRNGVLISGNGVNFTQLKRFGNKSFSGIFVKNNRMVLSTFFEGVYVVNLSDDSIEKIEENRLDHTIYGCYIDHNDLIWLYSLGGLIKVDNDLKMTIIDDDNGLPVNLISCLFSDKDDNFWIGSQGKGMFKYPGTNFKYYDQSTGYPSDLFLTGLQTKKGDYYFGTIDKGIIKRTKSGEIISLNTSENAIWASVQDVDGKNWFGSGSSLIEIDANDRIVERKGKENGKLPGTKISAFYRVSKDKMYIGGNGGISEYSNGKFSRVGDPNEEIGTVRDFELYQGDLYCATNLGLMILKNGRFEIVQDETKLVYNIEKDNFGGLWFGTEEGLFRLKKGVIKQVELLSDPASNFVAFMNHKDDKLFVGTNNGLFILADLSTEKPRMERFGTNDGVVDLETNLNSGFFDQNNVFWFGTASGLVSFEPSATENQRSVPQIDLISILLNYESFDYSKYSENLDSKGMPVSLILPHSKNNITFEIDGISLLDNKGTNFQFLLEGLRDTWSGLSDNSTISFSSLPAGDYLLHMRSVDGEGQFSEEIVFPIKVNRAFYNTWWFYSLTFAGIAGVIYGFIQFRFKRVAESNEKDKLRYKSKLLVLEQQSMNASMNRHFIFNSLNSIQYFINTQDRFSANKYLTSFAKLIRKNLDSATSTENMISLEDELERIQLYLSLESMRFKDRFDYEINVEGVDVESEMIPAMLMQPFIENSIIHGILPNEDKKGLITINVSIQNDYLEVLIQDNGVGIQNSLSKKTSMDGDHRSQGMEITSKRIELIQKISDNDISLVGPTELVGEDSLINGTSVLLKIPCENLVD